MTPEFQLLGPRGGDRAGRDHPGLGSGIGVGRQRGCLPFPEPVGYKSDSEAASDPCRGQAVDPSWALDLGEARRDRDPRWERPPMPAEPTPGTLTSWLVARQDGEEVGSPHPKCPNSSPLLSHSSSHTSYWVPRSTRGQEVGFMSQFYLFSTSCLRHWVQDSEAKLGLRGGSAGNDCVQWPREEGMEQQHMSPVCHPFPLPAGHWEHTDHVGLIGLIIWSLSLRGSQLGEGITINRQLESHGIHAVNPGPINLNETDSEIFG